jgi:aspartyl-tRNA synthetase
MTYYGSDKPDLRFDMKFSELTEIAKGKDFKDKLSVAHNVDWVYISPEKDYRNWVAANKKYNQTLNFYNSYYLLKGKRAALTRFFKVDQFPRYIVIDQRNRIVLNNAPSPLDEDVFEEIIESINAD